MNWHQQQEGEERQLVHQEGELEEEEQGEEELWEELQLEEDELWEEVQLEEEELAEEGLGGGEEEELCESMLQLQLDFDLHFSCGEYIYLICDTFLGSGLTSCIVILL